MLLNIVEQRKCETNIVEYTRTLGLPIHRILYIKMLCAANIYYTYTYNTIQSIQHAYTTSTPSTLAVCTTHSLNKSRTQNQTKTDPHN